MRKHLAINFSKVFLTFMLVILAILSIISALRMLSYGIHINSCINLITCLIYFFIIYNLHKIVYSTTLSPFCHTNTIRFKIIGYCMVFIAVIDGVVNFKSKSGFELFATKYGSLKISFLIYIVLACIALVLSEIFEEAVEIKNENDLTI